MHPGSTANSMTRCKKVIAIAIPTVALLVILLVAVARNYDSGPLEPFVCNSSGPVARENLSGMNTLVVYTGRWKFLKILFPYLYRELRKNGGILDRVWFMMMDYDDITLSRLRELVKVANKLLKEEVFQLNFMGYTPGSPPSASARYPIAYYEVFSDIIKNSSNRFFKMDDDIVYIHPGTFRNMIVNKNSDCCFLHFANIASNWRCNVKHQELGVYSSQMVNPKRLMFDFSPEAYCGWKSPECAELVLRTFIHHYRHKQLDKYTFNGVELLNRRKRFSINLFMLDRDLVDVKALQEVGVIRSDDEQWWTQTYSAKFRPPNCIVGDGLIVHFSYRTTHAQMIQLGLLSEFESIVLNEVGALMEKELWTILGFSEATDDAASRGEREETY